LKCSFVIRDLRLFHMSERTSSNIPETSRDVRRWLAGALLPTQQMRSAADE
jgi:hypothetical protein